MRFKILLILLTITVFQCSPVPKKINAPVTEVKVRIMERHHPVKLTIRKTSGRLYLDDSIETLDKQDLVFSLHARTIICSWKDKIKNTTHARFDSSGPLHIETGTGKKIERTYSGSLEADVSDDVMVLVNRTPVEDYIRGAALSELGVLLSDKKLKPHQRRQLIQAQEVCIRSAIFHSKSRHGDNPWDFCDLTHCFHFEGSPWNMQPPQEPVSCLLSGKGKPVEAFFHSTCGGLLAPPSVLWPSKSDDPIYRCGPDFEDSSYEPLCAHSPHSEWSAHITDGEMEQVLKAHNVDSITLHEKYGRIDYLEFYGDGSMLSRKVAASEFISLCGHRLGWNVVKSNCFTISRVRDGFFLKGKGLGHGTGFCQYGAQTLALKDYTWKQILHFYFPGSHIAGVME